MKVSLFITCLSDIFASNVGKDTVEILERVGCEVDFPDAQTCCGQPAYNSGYLENTKETMKHMMKVFRDSEVCRWSFWIMCRDVTRIRRISSAGILNGKKKQENLPQNRLSLPNFLWMC